MLKPLPATLRLTRSRYEISGQWGRSLSDVNPRAAPGASCSGHMCPHAEQQNHPRTAGLSVTVSGLVHRGQTTTALGEGPMITFLEVSLPAGGFGLNPANLVVEGPCQYVAELG